MQILSAIEAISPAWNHTRSLLRPLRLRTLLKIGVIALFTQFSTGTGSYSGNHWPGTTPGLDGVLLVVGLIAAILGLVVAFAFFYLNSRLQFVLFEVVLRRDTTIAPIWGRYGRATWDWMGIKFLYGLIAMVCALPFLILPVIHFIHIASSLQNDSTPSVAGVLHILGVLLPLFIPFLIAAIVIGCLYRVLFDFGLPSMALEGTSIGETARRVWQLVRIEPGPVFLYIVMHILLGFLMSLIALIISLLVIGIALTLFGGGGVALWYALHHAGVAGYIFMGLGWAVLGVIFAAVMIILILALTAYVTCFWQAYALYFLGGRYPLLGSYLEPLLPPPGYSPYGHPPPPSIA
jgi:hypothetical protein